MRAADLGAAIAMMLVATALSGCFYSWTQLDAWIEAPGYFEAVVSLAESQPETYRLQLAESTGWSPPVTLGPRPVETPDVGVAAVTFTFGRWTARGGSPQEEHIVYRPASGLLGGEIRYGKHDDVAADALRTFLDALSPAGTEQIDALTASFLANRTEADTSRHADPASVFNSRFHAKSTVAIDLDRLFSAPFALERFGYFCCLHGTHVTKPSLGDAGHMDSTWTVDLDNTHIQVGETGFADNGLVVTAADEVWVSLWWSDPDKSRQRVDREWQALLDLYGLPALPIPEDRVFIQRGSS